MKRLLVIANLHHASPRIPGLMAPLAKLGWQVTIVTPPLGNNATQVLGFPENFTKNVRLVEASYCGDIFWILRNLFYALGFSNNVSCTEQLKERITNSNKRKVIDWLMRVYQIFFAIPDTEWPWKRSAFKILRTLLLVENFDVMLSSSPFPTVHCIASRIKKIYQIPWVADFRDPWSQNHNYIFPKPRLWLDRWIEKNTLKGANTITTVSDGFARKLTKLHGSRIKIIRNGYQYAAECLTKIDLPTCFTISYTGTIYHGKQDPEKILVALRYLIDVGYIDPSNIVLKFYGRYDSCLQNAINEHHLEKVVTQCGVLPRSTVRQLQRVSHILLLLQWEDLNEEGIFPLKFYEYLSSYRPILATGGQRMSEISAILKETRAGYVATNQSEIEQVILRAYREYLKNGTCEYSGIHETIAAYSYNYCSQKLADILETVYNTSVD